MTKEDFPIIVNSTDVTKSMENFYQISLVFQEEMVAACKMSRHVKKVIQSRGYENWKQIAKYESRHFKHNF